MKASVLFALTILLPMARITDASIVHLKAKTIHTDKENPFPESVRIEEYFGAKTDDSRSYTMITLQVDLLGVDDEHESGLYLVTLKSVNPVFSC